MEQEILNYLLNHEALSASIDGRLYPLRLPRDTVLPAMTYQVVSKPRQELGSQLVRIQYDCYSDSYDETLSVARILEGAALASVGVGGVHSVFIDNDMDDYDEATERHRSVIDVIFYYLRTAEFER